MAKALLVRAATERTVAKVIANVLNVRYDRGTQYNVIGKLNKDDFQERVIVTIKNGELSITIDVISTIEKLHECPLLRKKLWYLLRKRSLDQNTSDAFIKSVMRLLVNNKIYFNLFCK